MDSDQVLLAQVIEELRAEVELLRTQVGKLNTQFEEGMPEIKKYGSAYELLIRRELREMRGVDYARHFRVKDLFGLARLVIPKNIKFDENGNCIVCSEGETSILLSERVLILAQKSLSNIKHLRKWIRTYKDLANRNGRKTQKEMNASKKWFKLDREMKKFNEIPKNGRLEFLKTSPLGLWSFTTEIFWRRTDFLFELEFDVRGTTRLTGNRIEICVGEIKSGKGKDFATMQLLKRLNTLSAACKILVAKKVEVHLVGECFTNTPEWSHQQPTISELEELSKSGSLLWNKNKNISIHFVLV